MLCRLLVSRGIPAILVLGLCLSGCSNSSSGASTTTGSSSSGSSSSGGASATTGQVVGAVSTAAPSIKSQTVAVQGTPITANVASDGTFALSGVPAGNQVLTVDDGTGTEGAVAVVSVVPGGTTVAGVLQLGPVGTLTGTITGSSGGFTLNGAQIFAAPLQSSSETLGNLPNGRPCFFGIADANGNYSLGDLPPGSYLVTANDQGFVSAAQTVTVAADATSTADFTLQAVAASSGTVAGNLTTDVNGVVTPVGNALVYLDGGSDPTPPVSPLPLGTPEPVVEGTVGTTGSSGGTASSAGGAGSLPITDIDDLLPASSAPLSNAPFFAFTDATGHYQLNGVATGAYTLYASQLGYQVASESVEVQQNQSTEVDLTLISNSGQVAGQVTDSSGAPLANAGVIIDASGDPFGVGVTVGTTGASSTGSATTGGDGTVVSSGGSGSSFSAVSGTSNSSGSSASSSGGQGIAIFPPLRSFALTDANGNYSIPSVTAGSYTVTAFDFNYLDQSENVTVTVGATATLNFQLPVDTDSGTSSTTGTTTGGIAVPVSATGGGGGSGSANLGTLFGSFL